MNTGMKKGMANNETYQGPAEFDTLAAEEKPGSVHTPFEPSIAGTQAPPPYICEGVTGFGFPLQADARVLQGLCDRFLNIAPPEKGISFEPVVVNPALNICMVTLEALDYDSLVTAASPWSELGEVAQQEFLFAIPVFRKENRTVVEQGIFIPYIFVTNQNSALTGREVLGLPKILAGISMDPDFPANDPIELRFEGRRKAGGVIQRDALVSITPVFNGILPELVDTRVSRFFGPVATFANSPVIQHIEESSGLNSFIGYSQRTLINPESPGKDSYRSIISSHYEGKNLNMIATPPMNVTFKSFLNFDIAATLGINVDGAGNAVSLSPYSISADFELGNVKVLWET